MDYNKNQENMDCMAGTAILKNLKQTTANLNITEHSTTANRRCLCLVQPKVVEQNNDNTKHRLMKENLTNYCNNSSSKVNKILTNNYITKIQQRQKFSLIIIMLLAIVVIEMPTMAKGKAIPREVSLELTLTADAASSLSSSQTSGESEVLLLSSEEEMAKTRQRVDIAAISLSATDEAGSSDSLTSLEVLRHIQRTQQHQQERRKRHRKRHINDLVITKYLHENSDNLEWSNPCNGIYQINKYENVHVPKQQYLKSFRKTVRNEHLSNEFSTNVINIADINDWSKHMGTYTFLPKLNRNGNITLYSWYRNMQTYVASFGYLARTQYKFDKKKQIYAGETSEELNKLLTSARHLLCELETTINGSVPFNNLRKLKTISREHMNKRLEHFQTKKEALRWGLVEANTVDLKFAKYSYLKYVSNMHTILNRKLKSKSRKHGSTFRSEENQSSLSSSIMIDEDSSNLSKSSIMKTDSRQSLADSFEMFTKSHRKQ